MDENEFASIRLRVVMSLPLQLHGGGDMYHPLV
jgi:hypothetical protein